MQVSVETINDKLMTVVWYGSLGFQCKSLGISDNNWKTLHNGVKIALSTQIEPEYGKQIHFATALPPLPRNPTADDAWLLYLYASHGLVPFMKEDKWRKGYFVGTIAECSTQVGTLMVQEASHGRDESDPDEVFPDRIIYSLREGKTKITHCTDNQGNRVDVAIKEV